MSNTAIARRLGIYLCWGIWCSALWLAVVVRAPGLYVMLLLLGGFAPYLLVLHVIEPWLDKRGEG